LSLIGSIGFKTTKARSQSLHEIISLLDTNKIIALENSKITFSFAPATGYPPSTHINSRNLPFLNAARPYLYYVTALNEYVEKYEKPKFEI